MKTKLIFCKSKVQSSGIRRESRGGVEHIIVTSYTLPPNVVMNNCLYPKEEINKSFKTLERSLAPIEHPQVDGQYISARDPVAINQFYGGAWNENVEQASDGRIKIDKVINVQEASKSDRGKRLLDRINAIESGDDNRSIHTSVGVFVNVEELDRPMTNAKGDEYERIARDMMFDHDAILLDSIGAATPADGVGIGVNSENVDVEFAICPDGKEIEANKDISLNEIEYEIEKLINQNSNENDPYKSVVASYQDYFIYRQDDLLFKSEYVVDNGTVKIQDTRLPVERVVEYRPINMPNEEDNVMRNEIIAALEKMGITVNSDISDQELMAKYSSALVANNGDEGGATAETNEADTDAIAKVVANAVDKAIKPFSEKLDSLDSTIKSKDEKELETYATVIVNSGMYQGLDVDSIKGLGIDKVKEMAANCQPSFGLSSNFAANSSSTDDENYDMPA